MISYTEEVNVQYGREQLINKILTALEDAGIDTDQLKREDLSSFDQFHIGGIAETRNLANRLPLTPDMKILDIGSGMGGPARTLAAEFGNNIAGIDLTEEYCIVAEELTKRVGLSHKIEFQQTNALDMPFTDESFDVLWSQFVSMNIEDRGTLYREYARVLKKGGYFAFHEVIAGNGEELHYPVFWADESRLSFLRPLAEMSELLESNGFEEVEVVDLTEESAVFFEKVIAEKKANPDKKTLGFNIFVGPETPLKAENILKNLREGKIKVIQAIFRLKNN